MLHKLKVRTRLIAVLAVPVVLLLAIATAEVLDRRESARAADRAVELTEAADEVVGALDAIQEERTISAALRAGDPSVVPVLEERRTATDSAMVRLERALDRVERLVPDLSARADTVDELVGGLDVVRGDADVTVSIVPWRDPFEPLVTELLDLQEDLGSEVRDADVGSELSAVAMLARSKDASSAQAAELAAATVWEELRAEQVGRLTSLRADEQAFRAAYLAASPADERIARRAEVSSSEITSASRAVETTIAEQDVAALGDLAAWFEQSGARQSSLRAIEGARVDEAAEAAREAGSTARRSANMYLALTGAALALAVGLALLAARSITQPLRRLTDAADRLAEERLPQLVDALRRPTDDDASLAASLEPIELRTQDELATLAKAFNAVQSVAVEVAAEQSNLLKKGISDIYVNLARRNQALIERQIRLLDHLESREQNPDVLEHLFQIDHLSTRMRRNAESLLVLAGAEQTMRRARPVPVVDAVRAALSEVEDYGRVTLGTVADGVLVGGVVSDVAHLLAELIENATQFSPPTTKVTVTGSRTGGSYQIVVNDEGMGLQPQQLEELNALLAAPPVTGLALGRSLGLHVAARLASRHGIAVRLRSTDGNGVAAFVVLPGRLLEDGGDDSLAGRFGPPSGSAIAEATGATPDDGGSGPSEVTEPAGGPQPVVVATAASLVAGLTLEDLASTVARIEVAPAESSTTPGRAPLPSRAAASAAAKLVVEPDPRRDILARRALPNPEDPWEDEQPPLTAPAAPSPVESSPPPLDVEPVTTSGLQRRVPGATAALTAPAHPDATVPEGGEAAPTRRSPEQVRSLLSRYRTGLEAGREAGGNPEEHPR